MIEEVYRRGAAVAVDGEGNIGERDALTPHLGPHPLVIGEVDPKWRGGVAVSRQHHHVDGAGGTPEGLRPLIGLVDRRLLLEVARQLDDLSHPRRSLGILQLHDPLVGALQPKRIVVGLDKAVDQIHRLQQSHPQLTVVGKGIYVATLVVGYQRPEGLTRLFARGVRECGGELPDNRLQGVAVEPIGIGGQFFQLAPFILNESAIESLGNSVPVLPFLIKPQCLFCGDAGAVEVDRRPLHQCLPIAVRPPQRVLSRIEDHLLQRVKGEALRLEVRLHIVRQLQHRLVEVGLAKGGYRLGLFVVVVEAGVHPELRQVVLQIVIAECPLLPDRLQDRPCGERHRVMLQVKDVPPVEARLREVVDVPSSLRLQSLPAGDPVAQDVDMLGVENEIACR